jgi:hypothetical protein
MSLKIHRTVFLEVKRPKRKTHHLPSSICKVNNKVKVQCTLVQVLRFCTGRTAYRGSRGVALTFHDHGTRRGEGSASRPGRFAPGKDPVPILQEAGWAQGHCGQVRKISTPPGFDPRTVQPTLPGPLRLIIPASKYLSCSCS